MKVAVVSITYNDGYKIKEWYEHYLEYKDDLFIHIIVDNNSNPDYRKELKDTFKNSHIIFRDNNGGCTGAYNDGIKYALSLTEVESIMLLANDIKLSKSAIPILSQFLSENKSVGMVSPIMFHKDSMVNADFGCDISNMLIMMPFRDGEPFESINQSVNFCKALTGGVNLSTRVFYEQVGLQDDNLFMYSDEVDMGLRAKEKGFKLAAIRDAQSWHQHINKESNHDRRDSFTKYLAGRNKVYVAKKHFGLIRGGLVFVYICTGAIYRLISGLVNGKVFFKDYGMMIFGAFMGLIGNMSQNKYSQPTEE